MKERELQSLLLKLADADVRQLVFTYEGSGDSGFIDQIWVLKTAMSHEDCLDEMYIEDFIPDNHVILQNHFNHDIVKDVENMAYRLVLEDIEDWVNNDGGFGWVVMDIPSGKTHVKNTVRYMETETYDHKVDLNEKLHKLYR